MSVVQDVSKPLQTQHGFLTAAQIPYLLLAIAVIGVLYLWTALQGKTEQLAALEDTKAKETAKLEQQLDKTVGALADLNAQHVALQGQVTTLQEETVPSLKRDASFARADNQRAQHIFSARDNLIKQLQGAKQLNSALAEKADQLPSMKKELSTAKAENMRLQHISNARDNLMVQLKHARQATGQLDEQTAQLASLKYQLSAANASNMRLEHVSRARDNLISDIKTLRENNAMLSGQSEKLPALKRQLSSANAANMRLEHISRARDNLMAQSRHINQINAGKVRAIESARDIEISALTKTIAGKTVEMGHLENKLQNVSREASFARAQAQRSQHLASARDNLMTQLSEAHKVNEGLSEANASLSELNENLSEQVKEMPALKHMLSAANAENMRLEHIRQARNNLMQQLASLKAE